MTHQYSPLKECASFQTWLISEWDVRAHWDGPSRLFRKHGIRFLGHEFEWLYLEVSDE